VNLDDLREFFRVFPQGAGEAWLAEHFGATQAAIAEACRFLGMERVESAGGVDWRVPKARPVKPASNVIPFRRRAPEVDDGEELGL
jgi:hypothetical protein